MRLLFVILSFLTAGTMVSGLARAAARGQGSPPRPTWYRVDLNFVSCRSKRRAVCRREFNPWVRAVTIVTRSRRLVNRLRQPDIAARLRTRLLCIAKQLRDPQVSSPKALMRLRARLARAVRRVTGVPRTASPSLLVVPHLHDDKQLWFEFTIGDHF